MLETVSAMLDGSYHVPMSSEIIAEVQLVPRRFYSNKSKVIFSLSN